MAAMGFLRMCALAGIHLRSPSSEQPSIFREVNKLKYTGTSNLLVPLFISVYKRLIIRTFLKLSPNPYPEGGISVTKFQHPNTSHSIEIVILRYLLRQWAAILFCKLDDCSSMARKTKGEEYQVFCFKINFEVIYRNAGPYLAVL